MPKLTKSLVDDLPPDPDKDIVIWDDTVKGFGLRVKPSGVKTYLVQYRNLQGRSRRFALGKHGVLTAEQARRQAKARLGEAARGEDPAEEKQVQRQSITVRELARRFLKKHVATKRKPATLAEYSRLLNKHILPVLGNRKVNQLERREVAKLHHSMRRTPTLANRVLAVLSALMTFAERHELRPLNTNPCRLLERYRESSRERYLSAEELARLGEALAAAEQAQTEHPSAILALRLLALTGMRKGEVLALRWNEVDLDHGRAHLPDSKTGKKIVPLAPPALEVLMKAKRQEGCPFVCWGRRSDKPFVGLQKVWERVRASADLEGVRIHDLRHTFASFGAASGFGLFVIGKVLGHTQASTTERYAHLGADPVHSAASEISRRVADALLRTRDCGIGHDEVASSGSG